MKRFPQPFRIKRLDGTLFYLDPRGFNITLAKRLHDWSGRLIKYYEENKNDRHRKN
jgi:hypothetical protein